MTLSVVVSVVNIPIKKLMMEIMAKFLMKRRITVAVMGSVTIGVFEKSVF